MTIIRGSIFGDSGLSVPSGRLDLRPPKILVGLSLSLLSERDALPAGAVILPAILDTGFNRTFEIDEWHLVHWAGLRTEHLSPVAKDKIHDGRKYELCRATLWLHRTPYEGPRTRRTSPPVLLARSLQVRVMATVGKPNPRLPLLGLNALIENKLQLQLDGSNSRFRIYRSIGTIVSSIFNSS